MGPPFDDAAFNRRLFYPRRDTSFPPEGAADRLIAVPGARLHLRKHAANGARTTVLLFHGNGEVVADYDDVAPLFADCGAALAVVDYRGYGQSDGEPTLKQLVDDAHAVIAALHEPSVIVMGRSLGSVAAADLYRKPPPEVVGFIWESGFVDLDALAGRRGLGIEARPPDDFRRAFDPIPKLNAGTSPLLVIHGADDDLIAPREGRAAFDAAGTAVKHLVYVPERGHNDLGTSPIYWQAIAKFVREVSCG
jgi:pimeloyl-ACP methyl ester carboxylesterase